IVYVDAADMKVHLVDAATGNERGAPLSPSARPVGWGFVKDGTLLLVLLANGTIDVMDPAAGRALGTLGVPGERMVDEEVAYDAGVLVAQTELEADYERVRAMVPSARPAASASIPRLVRVFDVAAAKELRAWPTAGPARLGRIARGGAVGSLYAAGSVSF